MRIPPNLEIGDSFVATFNATDIDAELLATSLGLTDFRFPDEEYIAANTILLRIIDRIVPHLKGKNDSELGEYLYEHVDEIMSLCEGFEQMGRFPALITKESLILYEDTCREHLQMNEKDYYHALLSCMHFMVYLSGIKKFGQLQARYSLPGMMYQLDRLVSDEGHMELDNAWGGRLSHQYEKIIPREKRDSLSDRYVPKGVYRIPSDIAMAYRKKTIDFWMQKDLPPERILIAITSLTGPYLTAEDNKKIAELDVEALNFFLCQSDSMIYAELITHIFSKSDHHATWVIWIHNYIDQLRQHGSEINKIFRAVFDLWDKEIFVPKGSKLTSGAKKKLPDILQLALLESQKNFLEKNPPSVSDSVADILGFSPYSTSTSLKSRSHQPEKEKVNNPNKSSLFIRGVEKEQLRILDLSGVEFPEGTTFQFERQLPKSKTFETLEAIGGQTNQIPVVLGKNMDGHFVYRLTINLPNGYIFEGNQKTRIVLEERIYATAELTPEEQVEDERRKKAKTAPISASPFIPGVVVPTVQASVTSVLEVETSPKQKTLDDTITAWELSLEEKSYSSQFHEDGTVVFGIFPYLLEELHDVSFGTINVDVSNTVTPPIEDVNIVKMLVSAAGNMRHEHRESLRIANEKEQEKVEYEALRVQFQPFYDFIAKQTFVDKNNKELFEKASDEFRGSLRGLAWSMPWRITKDGQIQFRHIRNDIKIIYSNLGGVMHVAGEKRTLSKVEERCYTEIAEAFSHLALFYTAEYRERQKMISREKKFQNDMLKGAESYNKLLGEGRARLVQYSSEGKGNIFVSKFPLDNKPQMLPEKVGHDTIESILGKHEHAELCYRRDIVRINGEISEDAGEQSLENTFQNLADLHHSPRARYILRKRVLITLDLEKFTENDRRPIQSEQKSSNTGKSAFDILQSLQKEKNIQNPEQVGEEFMDAYIDLLIKNKIRVQYVWPLSVSLADHQKQLEKNQKQKKTTAD